MSRIGTACRGCGTALPGASIPTGYRCASCRTSPSELDLLRAVWHYQSPLNRVIQELKFGGLAFLASDLGTAIAHEAADDLKEVDLIVPVPLHWRRHLVRGYNQAAEIARAISSIVDRPVTRALRKKHATRPQSSLPRSERRTNARGAFAVRREALFTDAHIGLVDDVATTGATLESCARVLKRAGARSVSACIAARTPPPRASLAR